MDYFRPNQNKVSSSYTYSGNVSGSNFVRVSGLGGRVSSASSFSAPAMSYVYSGNEKNVTEIFESNGIEVGEATPLQKALEFHADVQRIQADAQRIQAEATLEGAKILGASALNLVSGFLQGIASFGEALVDGAVTISATVVSVAADIVGADEFAQDVANSAASFTANDYVGGAWDKLYSTPFMKKVDDYAGLLGCERDGAIYGVAKSSGYYTAGIVLSGGGASTLATAAFMGVAETGKTSQKEFGKLYAENEGGAISMSDFYKTSAYATGKGIVTGAVYYGAGFMKEFVPVRASYMYENGTISYSVFKNIGKISNAVSIAVKATKPYLNEGISSLYDSSDYDWKSASIDAAGVVISEIAALGYKNASKSFKKVFKDSSSTSAPSNRTNATSAAAQKIKAAEKPVYTEAGKGVVGTIIKAGVSKGQEKFVKDSTVSGYNAVLSSLGVR